MKKLLVILSCTAFVAEAHDPGMSAATVDVSTREILVQVSFAPADLRALLPLSRDELAARSIELRTASRPLRATGIEAREVGADNVEFTLRFSRPADAGVTVRSPLLGQMPYGHRQVLTVRDSEGATVLTEVLSAAGDRAQIALGTPSPSPAPRRAVGILAIGATFALMLAWLGRPRRAVRAAA